MIVSVEEFFQALANANTRTNPTWKPVPWSGLLAEEREFISVACEELNSIIADEEEE